MFRDEIQSDLARVLKSAFPGRPDIPFTVEAPADPGHGDYASNAALLLARPLKKNPLAVAEEIQKSLSSERYSVEVAAPGFLNFHIQESALAGRIQEILEKPELWGHSQEGNGKTVMVEYFQPNIAKRLHVGHIRSAIIGDALKRMLLSQGYHAVSDTHVGDWGTQFGILLWAYKGITDAARLQKIEQNPFEELDALYVEANAKIAEEPDLRDIAKEEFARLERGDKENRGIWQWMVDASMENLERSRIELGLLPFEEHRGESFYETMMPPIVELALQKGVAKRIEDGAVIVDLKSEGLDEAVLVKSDGASTYLLRDLATIQYRKERWGFWKNLYVVDNRQSHHFRQIFRVAALLGFGGVSDSAHIELGIMALPEGPMSTRKGNVVYLEKLIQESISRARAVIAEKNPDLKNADEIARQVGLGALKYFDLSHHRKSDVVFSWKAALNFEGNSGPYIQYAHARLKSIIRKLKEKRFDVPKKAVFDASERRLAVNLLRLPEIIEDALADFTPNTLAEYLRILAEEINTFYHSHPVTQEPDKAKQALRAALIFLASATLARGLDLLGIEAPEEM
jgi:arginyl-tRNA synthetase